MRDVFVSYSRGDQPFVEQFVRSLQGAGVTTWFDLDDLLPGQKWENEIEDRIADAKIFLPFLSESGAQRRGYFQSEQVIALKAAMRVPSDQMYLMPVQLGSVAIPRDMPQYHAVDLSADGATEKVAQSLSAALDRQVTISAEACSSLREALKYHLGYEAKTNKEFVASFMNPDISVADSVALLERLANSRDSTRLATALPLTHRGHADVVPAGKLRLRRTAGLDLCPQQGRRAGLGMYLTHDARPAFKDSIRPTITSRARNSGQLRMGT